jgi:hypothetical protein
MSQRSVRSRRRNAGFAVSLGMGLGLISLAGASGVIADEANVTRGDLRAFAAGAGLGLNGHAEMVRTADGKTIVTVHVEGLQPNTAYGSHVHQQACGAGDADGHYKFDPTGPAAPPNEIWPSFTTNAAGIGNGRAVVYQTAGSAAVSVVVHAPGGAKIGCADLD